MFTEISACVICKNEVRRITGALDSLAWCKDVVVVDSGSTDGTIDAAKNHPCHPRVIHHDWAGFSPQRKFAADQCVHPWVLMLDADEECSDALAREIQNLTPAQTAGVALFRMPRKNYLAGKYMRSWSPDLQTRLIHKDRVTWDPQTVPEIRYAQPGFTEQKLTGPLLHGRLGLFSMLEINDGHKLAEYGNLYAQALHAQGRRASYLNLLLRPPLTFFKFYLLKGGILDGKLGLIGAYKATITTMLKYSVLYARQELEPQKPERTANP